MADISLARKYRPMTLDDYMGEGVKKTIMARFSDPRHYPQVILLYGNRGTGKTSMARLLAKEYNCQEKLENGLACGKCWACQEIEENLIAGGINTEGVTEINIATDGGKGAIEEMLEDAVIEPMPPLKYKIVIMDECHRATTQAQNALLKIVEEPPKHLVFIFCTTDPEKMIVPLRSRCQVQLEVKRPSIDELANHLLKVCKQEGYTTSLEALKIIAKQSDRTPREALGLLENVAIENGGKVTLDAVRNLTGTVSNEKYVEFFKVANQRENTVEAMLKFVQSLKDKDITCRDFINGLSRFTLDCMYIKYGIKLEDYPIEFAKSAKEIFGIYTTDELDTILQIMEYAIKMVNTDDNSMELVLMNTGLRVGKVRKLSMDLVNARGEAEFENGRSSDKNRQRMKEEDKEKNKAPSNMILNGIGDDILQNVFGSKITEIKGDLVNTSGTSKVHLDAEDDVDDDTDENFEKDRNSDILDFLKGCET